MSIEQRIRALAPLRFQALALLLLRREFGDTFEDVRDTAGEGNGCDGVVVLEDHVDGFQVRTIERELGDTQKRKARASIDLALTAIPKERGLPLKNFMFVFNQDLQPSEAKWFTDQKQKYKDDHDCIVTYRALGWIVDQLLEDRNAGIRREFVETEADRQLEILKTLNAGGQASQEALTAIIGLVQGLSATDDAKRALTTLLERARFHFHAGLESLAKDSFRAAVAALSEARELLKRHQDDPLYCDVVYWQAIAMLRANEYEVALPAFEEARQLYERVGRHEEALWAQGNKGHALRGLSRFREALEVFRSANAQWKARNDDYNILVGFLNEAEIHLELKDPYSAGTAFNAANAIITRLGAEGIVRLELMDTIVHFFGSFASFYFAVEDDEQALECLDTAITWARRGQLKHLLGKLISQSITPLAFQGRIDEAIERAREGESLLNEVGDKHSLGTLFNNLGVVYILKANLTNDPKALTTACAYFRKDYEICREVGDTAGAEKTLASMRQFGCPLP